MEKTHYHFNLGDYKCIAVNDGGFVGTADFLFASAPAVALQEALAQNNLEADKLPTNWICLLVDTGRETLLVDTGFGQGPDGGLLRPQLARIGYPAETIDFVFLSHGHSDHMGGCLLDDGRPAYPNARYLIGAQEFAYWMGPEIDADNPLGKDTPRTLQALEGQLDLMTSDTEILPGIKTLEAFGHTPGHLGLEIDRQNQRLWFLADSLLHLLHLAHPEWYSWPDVHPQQMIATRRRLLETAVKEHVLLHLFHFDFPGLGYVRKEGPGYSWLAADLG